MKRNWFAIAILSLGLSADALVLCVLLWRVLKEGGSGLTLGLAAFCMALVPYLLQRLVPALAELTAKHPARVYSAVRVLGLSLSLACALAPPHWFSITALYAVSAAYALFMFLTTQSLETLFSARVLERALSPNLASRILQTSVQVGAFMGGALSGFLVEWGGFRAVAITLALIYAFSALTIRVIEGLRDEPSKSTDGAKPVQSVSGDSAAIWGAFLMLGAIFVHIWAFNVIVPYLAGVERAWGARDYGLIDGFAGVGALVAALLMSGPVSRLWWLGFPGMALADLWLAGTHSVVAASMAAAVACFFGGMIRVKQREVLFTATSNSEQAARWAGHLSMISFLARALTPLALALCLDRIGGQGAFEYMALGLATLGFTLQLAQVLSLRFRPLRRKPVVAIVDAYGSGALLAPEFKSRGYDCVHVMSTTELSPVFYSSLKDEDFSDHLLFQGNVAETIEELRRHRVKQVLAGADSGIELADGLSERMSLPTNGTRMSRARRDKYRQIEAVRQAGLHCAEQAVVHGPEGALEFARALGEWPVVLKPLASSGTDSVYLCASEDELIDACRATLGRRNRYGKFNDEVVVQGFLQGAEFAVDTLSTQGQHRVTGVWRYEKATIDGNAFIYRTISLLDPSSPLAADLGAYARQVLGALAIQHGPTHQEIVLTPRGAALVECNARLCGPDMPQLWQSCTGLSLPSLMVDSYLDRRSFLRRAEPLGQLELQGRIVALTSHVDHCILDPTALDAIRTLESYSNLILAKKQAEVFPRTRDLFTVVGQVHLTHAEAAIVDRDTAFIRRLEASGLYVEVSAPREAEGYSLMRRPQLVRVKAPVERKLEEGT